MVERVVLGKKGNEYGLWVSKPGFNAMTDTNTDNFLVHPSIRPNDVFMAGEIIMDYQPAATFAWSVTHGLGFTPACVVWYNCENIGGNGTFSNVYVGLIASPTTLAYSYYAPAGAGAGSFSKFRILYNIYRTPLVL